MRLVSIVVPCYNEEARIGTLLEAIAGQTYPSEDMEVVVADGMSTDRTREVVETFSQTHTRLPLRLIPNLKRSIPSAVNAAVAAAEGGIIVRLDGHSQPYPDYVERCVAGLESGAGENVGGIWEIRPGRDGWIAASIASAAAHPLGVGDALYRHATRASHVDTVPFGAFRRELFERVGGFDETLLTNEDYEFNARIRRGGGRIWLDPQIRSVYYARESLGALARQYWRYGFWKYRMLQRYPATLRWRQALPPLFVLALILGLVFAWLPIVRWLLVLSVAAYLLVLVAAGLQAAVKHRQVFLIWGLPLAIACMHLSWGSGFIWSMIAGNRPPAK
jgi:glycosyltransferase involved in cell wall biosynthesis